MGEKRLRQRLSEGEVEMERGGTVIELGNKLNN